MKDIRRRGTTDAQSIPAYLQEKLMPFRVMIDDGDNNLLVQHFATESKSTVLARKYGDVL
jgi:hypothetical protein